MGTCREYAWNMREATLERVINVWHVYGICIEFVWKYAWNVHSMRRNTHGILMGFYVEYVRNVRGTCKDAGAYAEHMWNMHGICLESIRNLYEYVWNMQGICDVRICMECARNTHGVCEEQTC